MHTELYPGCKNYSRLSFIIKLSLIKSRGKMNDVTFRKMVHLLKNAFPDIKYHTHFMRLRNLLEHWVIITRRLMRAKMIACYSGSKTKTWMLVRYAISLDGNQVRLLHWKKRKKVSKKF